MANASGNTSIKIKTEVYEKMVAHCKKKKNKQFYGAFAEEAILDKIREERGGKHSRSAKTGEFVKEEFAKKHPNTTVTERD